MFDDCHITVIITVTVFGYKNKLVKNEKATVINSVKYRITNILCTL